MEKTTPSDEWTRFLTLFDSCNDWDQARYLSHRLRFRATQNVALLPIYTQLSYADFYFIQRYQSLDVRKMIVRDFSERDLPDFRTRVEHFWNDISIGNQAYVATFHPQFFIRDMATAVLKKACEIILSIASTKEGEDAKASAVEDQVSNKSHQ